ncbi:MAG: glycosyltransferase family 39 protein [Candidatus Bathyarchaeota archaeon]|nr:glycosyltransferase family 39 protein [Candidatus Bathyarchaeum sp.]
MPITVRNLNKWRLALAVFLIVYAILLTIQLSYTAILWDETPHLNGGLLLSQGQIQEYLQADVFYPPAFDLVTSLFFQTFGTSVLSARLVAVIFSILSVWAVFELAYKMYEPRTAMVASILLASMPGFVWLSRMALLETMLMFFFLASLALFFSWMHTNSNKTLFLCGLTLGIGVLVKYQAIVSGIIMLVTLLIMGRQRIVNRIGKFLFIVLIAVAICLPWIFLTYQQYASETLGTWLYSLQMGNEKRLAYSTRFPSPIFYLIEMTWPYPYIHPISIFVYIITLLGLIFLLTRRKQEDKFLLITFTVVYFVFTLITSKDWRYITLVFPILAICGSEFILALWDKTRTKLKAPHISLRTKNITKISAIALVLLVSASVVYSSWEAYLWVETEQAYVPVGDACKYVAENTVFDQTTVVLFTSNMFSLDMVKFYMQIYDPDHREMLLYPEQPNDVFSTVPNKKLFVMTLTVLIERFEALNVKYLVLFEYGNNLYFNSDLRPTDVLELMLENERFTLEKEFGSVPRRIFIIRFLSSS